MVVVGPLPTPAPPSFLIRPFCDGDSIYSPSRPSGEVFGNPAGIASARCASAHYRCLTSPKSFPRADNMECWHVGGLSCAPARYPPKFVRSRIASCCLPGMGPDTNQQHQRYLGNADDKLVAAAGILSDVDSALVGMRSFEPQRPLELPGMRFGMRPFEPQETGARGTQVEGVVVKGVS